MSGGVRRCPEVSGGVSGGVRRCPEVCPELLLTAVAGGCGHVARVTRHLAIVVKHGCGETRNSVYGSYDATQLHHDAQVRCDMPGHCDIKVKYHNCHSNESDRRTCSSGRHRLWRHMLAVVAPSPRKAQELLPERITRRRGRT